MTEKTREKRDLDRTRRLILEAAAVEFSEHGATGARVDAIARRAGVNKAMIYYIFRSKDGLHLSVMEELFEQKTMALENRMMTEGLTRAELMAMLSDYFDAFMERTDYARIMLYDLAAGAPTLRRLKKLRPELFAFFDRVTDEVRRMSGRGAIREIDADKGVMTVILLMSSLCCALPHMDLATGPDSKRLRKLSDPAGWKEFMAGVVTSIIS